MDIDWNKVRAALSEKATQLVRQADEQDSEVMQATCGGAALALEGLAQALAAGIVDKPAGDTPSLRTPRALRFDNRR
jgi:hypothetical protein